MRFSLVPERNGRKIVASPVGVAMFDRNANLFFEDYWVFNVETIEGYRVRPVRATTSNDAVVRTIVDLGRAPGAAKIIFRTSAVQCGRPSVIRTRRRLRPGNDVGSGWLAWHI